MNNRVILGFVREWGGVLWRKIYKNNKIEIWFLLTPVIVERILYCSHVTQLVLLKNGPRMFFLNKINLSSV